MPDDDIDFEPWTNCAVWPNRTTEVGRAQAEHADTVMSYETIRLPLSLELLLTHGFSAALRIA